MYVLQAVDFGVYNNNAASKQMTGFKRFTAFLCRHDRLLSRASTNNLTLSNFGHICTGKCALNPVDWPVSWPVLVDGHQH